MFKDVTSLVDLVEGRKRTKEEKAKERREKDLIRVRLSRDNLTEEEKEDLKQKNKEAMALKRQSLTEEQKAERREKDKKAKQRQRQQLPKKLLSVLSVTNRTAIADDEYSKEAAKTFGSDQAEIGGQGPIYALSAKENRKNLTRKLLIFFINSSNCL